MTKERPVWLSESNHKKVSNLLHNKGWVKAVEYLLKIAKVHTVNPSLIWCAEYVKGETGVMERQPKPITHLSFSLSSMRFSAH